MMNTLTVEALTDQLPRLDLLCSKGEELFAWQDTDGTLNFSEKHPKPERLGVGGLFVFSDEEVHLLTRQEAERHFRLQKYSFWERSYLSQVMGDCIYLAQ